MENELEEEKQEKLTNRREGRSKAKKNELVEEGEGEIKWNTMN